MMGGKNLLCRGQVVSKQSVPSPEDMNLISASSGPLAQGLAAAAASRLSFVGKPACLHHYTNRAPTASPFQQLKFCVRIDKHIAHVSGIVTLPPTTSGAETYHWLPLYVMLTLSQSSSILGSSHNNDM